MNLQSLFPTPVAFVEMPRQFTKKELNTLIKQEQRPNMGNTTSINNYLLDLDELANFRSFIQSSVDEYFKTVYSPKHNVSLRITQSWTNYTTANQFHHKHAHPNSIVSGVFYIQTDPNRDKIHFYRTGYTQIKFPTDNWNMFNSESWWFEAVPNRLILFPSYLEHMVESLPSDAETRISLSFNTFPIGTIGEGDDLTQLIL